MLNKKILATLALSSVLVLGACGSDSADSGEENTLVVGASNTPHGEILEHVQPALEEEGINLEIVTYDDYVIPNEALEAGDIDANYFQHIPFFEEALEQNGYDFVNAGSIHLEPIGAYSQDYNALSELPDGATILVSSNAPDYGRVLKQFQDEGLITVDESVELTQATFEDIEENPHDFNFEYDYDPALMPTLYSNNEGDVVYINANFAVDAGIDILEEAIHLEDSDSPYANIIAVRSEDENDERIAKLIEALTAEDTQDFILEQWGGAVIPAE